MHVSLDKNVRENLARGRALMADLAGQRSQHLGPPPGCCRHRRRYIPQPKAPVVRARHDKRALARLRAWRVVQR